MITVFTVDYCNQFSTPFLVFSVNGMRVLERGYTMDRQGYWRLNFQKSLLQCLKSFQKAAFCSSTPIVVLRLH